MLPKVRVCVSANQSSREFWLWDHSFQTVLPISNLPVSKLTCLCIPRILYVLRSLPLFGLSLPMTLTSWMSASEPLSNQCVVRFNTKRFAYEKFHVRCHTARTSDRLLNGSIPAHFGMYWTGMYRTDYKS